MSTIILSMLKIDDFCRVRKLSRYRLAQMIDVPKDTLGKRARLGWMAYYDDDNKKLYIVSNYNSAKFEYDLELTS